MNPGPVDQTPLWGFERKWWIAAAFTPNLLLMGVSSTILDVPGPFLIDELGSDKYRFQWVSGSTLLATVIGLAILPWLRDRFGLRTVYVVGILMYSIASAWCGFAQSWQEMAIARFPQGFAKGLVVANVLALMYREYPRHRDVAMAFYGVGIYFGKAIAPTIGAFLIDYPSWRWLFFSQVPVGLATFIFSWWILAPDKPNDVKRHGFDWIGLFLLIGWLTPMILCLDRGDYLGWSSSNVVVGSITVSVVLCIVFVLWEFHIDGPLIDVTLFREKTFLLAECCKSLFAANFYAVFTTMAHYMVVLRDYPRTTTGLVLLPGGLCMGATLLIGAWLAPVWDRKNRLALGMIGLAASTWLLSGCDYYTDKRWILLVFCFWGASAGLVVSPVICLPLEGLTQTQVVRSAAIKNMVRILPGTFASLTVAVLLEQGLDAHFDELRQSIARNRPVVETTMDRLADSLGARGGIEPEAQAEIVMRTYVRNMANSYAVQGTLKVLACIAGAGAALAMLLPPTARAASPPRRRSTT